jgi:hypothetical protein
MPGPSSSTSPAWDPSSRTPQISYKNAFSIPGKYSDHSKVQPSNASIDVPVDWALASELHEKSFLVRIQGTKGNGGWEGGEYENDIAAYKGPGVKVGDVKVQIQGRLPKKMDIPARFITPISPYKQKVGEIAIVVIGDDVGEEVKVKNVDDDDSWEVRIVRTRTRVRYPPLNLAALPLIRDRK